MILITIARTLGINNDYSTDRQPILRSNQRTIYTAGRPPWYDIQGKSYTYKLSSYGYSGYDLNSKLA